MDLNPTKFPILSYVMSRVPQFGPKPTTDPEWHQIDVEQPPPPPPSSDPSTSSKPQQPSVPHINNPEVLQAVSEVYKNRSILQTLGDRPDHEAVDRARALISNIESNLTLQLEQITLDPQPEDVDPVKWRAKVEEKETECRKEAEKEKEMYKAVVRLYEKHEAYEKMVKEAEDRLVAIYGTVEAAAKRTEEEVEVNEEIVKILQAAEEGEGVERVDLTERQLRILPEAFGKLRGLVSLNLSTNQLETIPDAIAGLEILEELNLSSNLLESLPDSIGLLLNLKVLNVSANKLKALPDSISHCRSLVELDASFNALTYLPTNIGYELVNLRRLSVHLNKIRSLPTSICEMTSLRILDAHFNEIHVLPRAIGRLTNLENLNLSSNFSDLRELPETLGDLTNLKELDLSNNQIHALPDTFGRLDNLIKLNLDQNPIAIPPMEIVNEGVEAVKEFMSKRWLDILLEEEQRSRVEANNQTQTGWLTRSTSLLSNWASVVSESVTGYLGAGDKSPRDPYLDQQL